MRLNHVIYVIPYDQRADTLQRLDSGRLDHPASDASPFGKAVSKRAAEGDGWLTGIVQVDNTSKIKARFRGQAVDGQSTNPEGYDMSWTVIGVLGTVEK